MENQLIPMEPGGTAPSILDDVTERVRYYARRNCADMLELGKALAEAKEIVPHGEWAGYVQENTGLSERNAQYYMQAYMKFGTGNPRVSTLSIGKVIALLPASNEQAEKVMSENNINEMTTREIKEAIRKAREEEQEKARESMEAMAADKLNELARQKDAYDRKMQKMGQETQVRIDEIIAQKDAEAREALSAMQEEIAENRKTREALEEKLKVAEETAKEATQAAIDGTKSFRQQSAEAETEARKLRREVEEKDTLLHELQEEYNQLNAQYLDAQSAIAKGDAERTTADILSATAVGDAVRIFIGQVGRVPFMHGTFATMDDIQLEEYRANVMQVKEWAEKSLAALETVATEGGVY